MRLTSVWSRAALPLGVLALAGLLFAACGGGGGGSDQDYAKSICESNEILEDVLTAAIAAAFSGEESDTDEIVSALEDWVEALDDANPPSDVEEYHDDVVRSVREAIDTMKSGDTDLDNAFESIAEPAEPPQEIQDRITAAAADVPECDGVEVFG